MVDKKGSRAVLGASWIVRVSTPQDVFRLPVGVRTRQLFQRFSLLNTNSRATGREVAGLEETPREWA
jgi:hypothetical protein